MDTAVAKIGAVIVTPTLGANDRASQDVSRRLKRHTPQG